MVAMPDNITNAWRWAEKNSALIAMIISFVWLHAWFIAAAIINFQNSIFFLVLIAVIWAYLIGAWAVTRIPWGWTAHVSNFFSRHKWIEIVVGIGSMIALFVFLILDGFHSSARLWSTGCLAVIMFVSIVLSEHPAKIKFRPVVSGILLQYALAYIVLKWEPGRVAIQFVVDNLVTFLAYSAVGTGFVFNYIPSPPNICGMDGPFSFTSLPVLVYFSAICGVWYYLGILQWVLRRVSVVLQWIMGTTAAETLNAVASSFMGPTEAAVLMRYSLPSMTKSEVVATIAVGSSMISGSLFNTYISFGACAPLLLAANVMSAPATLVVSKLFQPETQQSRQKDMSSFVFPPCEDSSMLESISNGAFAAMPVVGAIIANLIVYLAAMALIDSAIQFLAGLLGFEGITFEVLMGYIFFPLAYMMGSSAEQDYDAFMDETLKVAQLIGTKTVLNEFIAYQQMQGMLIRGELHPRGQLIAVFALCGYSNPSNIGSLLAQFASMCPSKIKDIIPAATKSFYIGSLACFMTACVAGSLLDGDGNGCIPNNPEDTCLNLNAVAAYFNQTATF